MKFPVIDFFSLLPLPKPEREARPRGKRVEIRQKPKGYLHVGEAIKVFKAGDGIKV